jgi:segregation and condensation protein B
MEELETVSNPPENPESEPAATEPQAPPEQAAEAAPAEQAAPEEASAEDQPEAAPAQAPPPAEAPPEEAISADDLLAGVTPLPEAAPPAEDAQLLAVLEAIVYITDEPLSLQQIAAALAEPPDRIKRLLDELLAEYEKPVHGLTIREVAGGYKMATKPEHHEAVRNFVKSLKPPLKLSLAALETLAVIAYKQPVTAPEIMEIRGVQGTGVLKTLLDRKLIAAAGRKNVIGKPILYKTTKEFLVQFGLKDLSELPTLKEFEEIGRLALSEPEAPAPPEPEAAEPAPAEPEPAMPEPIEPEQ